MTRSDGSGSEPLLRVPGPDGVDDVLDPPFGLVVAELEARDQVTDPVDNVTKFRYDGRDRLTREIDPLGRAIHYDYNTLDNLVRKTDRNGRVTEFEYDDLDRLVEEIWRNPDNSVANTVTYEYDKASNLVSVFDSFNALIFAYDDLDRVTQVDNAGTPGAPRVVLEYTYDDAGNVTSVTDTINGEATRGGSFGGAAGPIVQDGLVVLSSGYGIYNHMAGNLLLVLEAGE